MNKQKKLVVFTGAGMSADSGLSTFRDSDGLWDKYRIEDVCTPEALIRNRETVIRFYNIRRKELLTVEPNAGHRALARLEQYFDTEIITQNIDSIAKASVPPVTPDELLDRRAAEMEAADPDLKNLIREYHDGLLLYEISNRTVWEKAAADEKGLERWFKKNRKKYRWDEPRYKGIAYFVKDASDIDAVKDAIKKVDFKNWADTLRRTFNDSIIRVRVVKGIFKKGDNALVDKMVFKADTTVTPPSDYPIPAVYGKRLKSPKSYEDVRELVVADYQEQLEKQWVAELRRKYAVTVNKDVLATVNRH